jgi:glycosyltransferase involved in cell wall biosynthesis
MMRRILILEPYYGGSHKLFLNGLQKTVEAEYVLLTLPARKWKMRMQLSALWFIQEIKKIPEEKRIFDTVLCSTFVDVAVLRSLLIQVSGWNGGARVVTYYHENQFVYPGQTADPTIRQFTAINFSTALASDFCAFNSSYNLESFLSAITSSLKKATDMELSGCVDEIRKKSMVLYPGMDYSCIDKVALTNQKKKTDGPPVIVWNHRWEHDKGPELFFDALYFLQKKGVDFRLVVMGESFVNRPGCFEEATVRLEKEIIHFGYAKNLEEYVGFLHQGDVIISTAKHEFFGISVLEGIRAGCYPLLPADLSYPELYDKQYLYAPGKLGKRLLAFIKDPIRIEQETAQKITSVFDWAECESNYENFLYGNILESE